jgi:membrane protease YdiL (CAAX protease family)
MKRPLLAFFALVHAVAWACFMAAGAIARGSADSGSGLPPLAAALVFLGAISPSLVALALTARAAGRAATRALVEPIFRWRVGLRWYAFAVGFIPAIELSVALLHRLATGAWPPFGETAWYVMAAAIPISTWVQAGEEIGWRGYALPRLTERFGLPLASVILGVVWAGWHLPLFFLEGSSTFGQSFPLYLLQVTALSVAMAWLYWRTGGSLLLVMLLHAAVNNTKDIVPSAEAGATYPWALSASPVAWLTVALLWLAGGLFLLQMRRAPRSRPARP